jgi:hypothetical protein
MSGFAAAAALAGTIVGQIPLSPPLTTRLIALVVVEIVLAVIVVLLYLKYVELKSVPLDEWWARRLEKATPRMRRMIRESQEIYEEEQAAVRGEEPTAPSADDPSGMGAAPPA